MEDKQELGKIIIDLSGQSIFEQQNDDVLSEDSNSEDPDPEEERFGVQYAKRNQAYTNLLEDYVSHHKEKDQANSKYKCAFFIITISLLAIIVVFSLVLICIVSSRDYSGYSDVAVVLGCVSGIVSSIIVLPKIIAQHLFPVDEDKHILGIVQNMQQHDERLRNIENTSEE